MNLINATLGNKPVALTANDGYLKKLGASALKACRTIQEKTIALRMPGDCFGIEVRSGKCNYSQCFDWQVNFNIEDKKGVVEAYLSWYHEDEGKQAIGKTEIFFFPIKELEGLLY